MSNDYDLIDVEFDLINNSVYNKLQYLNYRPDDPMDRVYEYISARRSGRSFIDPLFKGIKKKQTFNIIERERVSSRKKNIKV